MLRNRQAAQSSRERKRQEVEKLEGEKQTIEEQNKLLKERLMTVEHEKFKLQTQVTRMAAELSALRSGSSSSRSSVDRSHDLGADLLNQRQIKQEVEQQYPHQLHSPPDSISQCPSSSFSPTPSFSSFSRSPSPSQLGLGFHALNTSPDMTQHPAAMLCDLQCQSGEAWPAALKASTTRDEIQRPSTLSAPSPNTLNTRLFFLTLCTTIYSQLVHPLLQISHSLKTGLPLSSNLMTQPTFFHLIQWLILTPADLTGLTTASMAATSTSTATKDSSRTTTPSQPIFRIRLLRRLLLCSPALARPLLGATVRAMRAERSTVSKGKEFGSRGVGSGKSWSRLMVLAFAIECISKQMEKGNTRTMGPDLSGNGRQNCTMALEESSVPRKGKKLC